MTKLNGEASVLQLLQEMTVREKIDLLTGASNFSSREMKKYGIPSIRYLDGATGVNLLHKAVLGAEVLYAVLGVVLLVLMAGFVRL